MQLERLLLCNGRSSSGFCMGFLRVIKAFVSMLSLPSGRLSHHVVFSSRQTLRHSVESVTDYPIDLKIIATTSAWVSDDIDEEVILC